MEQMISWTVALISVEMDPFFMNHKEILSHLVRTLFNVKRSVVNI